MGGGGGAYDCDRIHHPSVFEFLLHLPEDRYFQSNPLFFSGIIAGLFTLLLRGEVACVIHRSLVGLFAF